MKGIKILKILKTASTIVEKATIIIPAVKLIVKTVKGKEDKAKKEG